MKPIVMYEADDGSRWETAMQAERRDAEAAQRHALLAKLLPCPFCGHMPEQMAVGDMRRGLMIECQSEHCPTSPSVSYHEYDHAIRAWNTRAPFATTASV